MGKEKKKKERMYKHRYMGARVSSNGTSLEYRYIDNRGKEKVFKRPPKYKAIGETYLITGEGTINLDQLPERKYLDDDLYEKWVIEDELSRQLVIDHKAKVKARNQADKKDLSNMSIVEIADHIADMRGDLLTQMSYVEAFCTKASIIMRERIREARRKNE